MHRVMAFVLAAVLTVSCTISVLADDSWTCPGCGREGNTGSFCGNCGHPSEEYIKQQLDYYGLIWPSTDEELEAALGLLPELKGYLTVRGSASAPDTQTADEVSISSTSFPDNTFRSIVNGFDLNRDKKLSRDELSAVISVNCADKGIGSLKGIEHFTSLEELYCQGNKLTELDVSSNTALVRLTCSRNKLKSIDLSNNTKLQQLNINSNILTALDLKNNTELVYLGAWANRISSLNISGCRKLQTVVIEDNRLPDLDISHNTGLTLVFVNNNRLTKLDTSRNKKLCSLECAGNSIKELDLTNNPLLERLRCDENKITTLNISKCSNLIQAKDKGKRTDKTRPVSSSTVFRDGTKSRTQRRISLRSVTQIIMAS